MQPRTGAALVLVSVMVLGMPGMSLDRVNGWSLLFMTSASVGAVLALHRFAGMRWIAASLPFWAMSGSGEWADVVAAGLVLLGLVIAAVGPTLPGRRRRVGLAPLPHLSSGALVDVAPRVFPSGRPSRVLRVAIVVLSALTIGLAVLAASGGDSGVTGGLAMATGVMAATFLFANWFAGRARVRVDAEGVHGRTLLREHSVPWSEVVGVSLRYVFLPGVGARIVYYCVQSPERECAFPSSMQGAKELQATIEAATGLAWPVPTITPTL